MPTAVTEVGAEAGPTAVLDRRDPDVESSGKEWLSAVTTSSVDATAELVVSDSSEVTVD